MYYVYCRRELEIYVRIEPQPSNFGYMLFTNCMSHWSSGNGTADIDGLYP